MRIYVECKPDAALLQTLGFPKKSVPHRRVFGKGEVLKQIERHQGVIMLIDEDRHDMQPEALRGLPVEELDRYHLKVARRGQSKIVIVCPNLEAWLLWLAGQAGIDPEQYGLPRNVVDLHKVINKRLDNLKKFLTSLMEHPKSKDAFQKLQALLQEV